MLETGPDRAVKDAMLLAAVFALFPAVLAWPGLDNYTWCEDGATIRWVGAIVNDPSQLFRFYGVAFYPVTMAVITAQVMLLGASMTALHSTDLLLHVVNGVLLAGLFARWMRDPVPAALAALAWMLSRHTDEALFWMGARQHALAFLFAMMAWHADELGRRRWSVALVAASVLSKEVGLVIVPLVTLRRVLFAESGGLRARVLAAVRETWRPWALAAAYMVFRGVAALLGARDGYPVSWIQPDPVHKFAYLGLQYLELSFLPWNSDATLLLAVVVFGLVLWRGPVAARFGIAWMLVALLPFQPLTHFSARYSLFPYAGFLCAVLGSWHALPASRRRALKVPALALVVMFLLYQGYVVFLDEKDYDMRSRFVEKLAGDYAGISSRLPDGPVAVMPVSGVNVQPVINARCHVPKLNAPLPLGLWGIIPAEDLIGMVEFSRGRAWIPAASAPPGTPLVVHRGDTFVVDRLVAGETRPVVYGVLVPLSGRN